MANGSLVTVTGFAEAAMCPVADTLAFVARRLVERKKTRSFGGVPAAHGATLGDAVGARILHVKAKEIQRRLRPSARALLLLRAATGGLDFPGLVGSEGIDAGHELHIELCQSRSSPH